MTRADFSLLDEAGLNLHSIFNLDELPAAIAAPLRRSFDPEHRYRQLILIGHAGKTLWASVKASGIRSENPIDDFSVATVEQWFAAHFPDNAHAIVYPGDIPVGLQALGQIAGWHHASPFMIGIQEEWGSWYAYRAVLLADTALAPSSPTPGAAPCARCSDKVCVASCPGEALADGAFSLEKCVGYRKQAASRCKATCLARVSCPVGSAHRYSDEQLRHTYAISMKTIERYY
jgi:epoxyqueuosine reductase